MGQEENEKKEEYQAQRDANQGLPTPDFSGLITGLYTQTLLAMGLGSGVEEGESKIDLKESQFLIDTIGMLEKKTSGNLTEQESNYLRQVLNDLRMRFVSAASREEKQGGEKDKKEEE